MRFPPYEVCRSCIYLSTAKESESNEAAQPGARNV